MRPPCPTGSQASTTFTLPSGSPYTLTMETGLLTTTFTLISRYELLLDGAARWSLVSCFEFTEIPVSVGTDADPRQLILDTINANMDAEGVTGYDYTYIYSSQPDLSSLSVGDRAEVSYDFSAEGRIFPGRHPGDRLRHHGIDEKGPPLLSQRRASPFPFLIRRSPQAPGSPAPAAPDFADTAGGSC